MKKIQIVIAVIYIATLTSCGGGSSHQAATAEGFTAIEQALKSKFGDDAYYTDLSVTYNASVGNIIGVTVTEDPASLQMGQWNEMQGTWTQNSDITLEIPKGTNAEEYMFQLNDNINLTKLGGLIETSSKKLTLEKNIEHPTLAIAYISFPDNGDIAKANYNIKLKPENGGTSFNFSYSLNGALIEMDY